MQLTKCSAIFAAIVSTTVSVAQIPHLDVVNGYDWTVEPRFHPCASWDITAQVDHAFDVHSYQAAEDRFGNSDCFRKRCDVLQLWDDEQDFVSALKGDTFETERSQILQRFNLNDDDGSHARFKPSAHFDITSATLSARRYLGYGFVAAAYLPVRSARLDSVTWVPASDAARDTFDSQLVSDFVEEIERIGDIDLSGWDRTGAGDLVTRFLWERSFPQRRRWIHGVTVRAHVGASFPTGKRHDNRLLFGIPFGHNAGAGIIGGGYFGVQLGSYLHLGVDAQLHHLFGKTQKHRIKTHPDQTDLLFLQVADVFREPGFRQHFTLHADWADWPWCGCAARLAYDHTKQHEDILFVHDARFDREIVNSAESVDEWTGHAITASLMYDTRHVCSSWPVQPYFQLYVRHGFNGKRATLPDTVGGVVSIAF